MVIRGVPVDVVIIDDPLARLPTQGDFDQFTAQWLEACEWYQACGGTLDGWWDMGLTGRAEWLYSVWQLERKVCR